MAGVRHPAPTTTGTGRVLTARRGTLATAVRVVRPAAVTYNGGRHQAPAR